jgi:hypothetical protein
VLERTRLVLGENDDLACPFSEAFEQCPSTLLSPITPSAAVEGAVIVAEPSVATEPAP